jgi:WD40 repeat protein
MKRRTWIILALVLALALVVVLNYTLGPTVHQIFPDGEGVWGVAFSPDGKTLALAGKGKVKLWDVGSRKELATLEGHAGNVYCVAFSPDGKLLASGGGDHTVRLWHMPGGKEAAILKGHTGEVKSVAFSPDGTMLASGAVGPPILKLWDVAGAEEKTDLQLWFEDGNERKDMQEYGGGEVMGLAFSPNGKVLALAKAGAPALFCDLVTGEVTLFPRGYQGSFDALAFSPDGKFLATGGSEDGQLWDVASGKEVATYQRMRREVAFSPDGKIVAGESGPLWLWDVATGKELARVDHGWKGLWWGYGSFTVSAVAFSPDGKTLVTSSHNGAIMLWEMATVLKGNN